MVASAGPPPNPRCFPSCTSVDRIQPFSVRWQESRRAWKAFHALVFDINKAACRSQRPDRVFPPPLLKTWGRMHLHSLFSLSAESFHCLADCAALLDAINEHEWYLFTPAATHPGHQIDACCERLRFLLRPESEQEADWEWLARLNRDFDKFVNPLDPPAPLARTVQYIARAAFQRCTRLATIPEELFDPDADFYRFVARLRNWVRQSPLEEVMSEPITSDLSARLSDLAGRFSAALARFGSRGDPCLVFAAFDTAEPVEGPIDVDHAALLRHLAPDAAAGRVWGCVRLRDREEVWHQVLIACAGSRRLAERHAGEVEELFREAGSAALRLQLSREPFVGSEPHVFWAVALYLCLEGTAHVEHRGGHAVILHPLTATVEVLRMMQSGETREHLRRPIRCRPGLPGSAPIRFEELSQEELAGRQSGRRRVTPRPAAAETYAAATGLPDQPPPKTSDGVLNQVLHLLNSEGHKRVVRALWDGKPRTKKEVYQAVYGTPMKVKGCGKLEGMVQRVKVKLKKIAPTILALYDIREIEGQYKLALCSTVPAHHAG